MALSAGADGDWRCTITVLTPDAGCHLAHRVLIDLNKPWLSSSGFFTRMHASQSCLADTDMLPPCATAHTQTFCSLWTSAMLEYVSIHNARCATFVMLPLCALEQPTHTTSLWPSARHAKCCFTTHYNACHLTCRTLSLADPKRFREFRAPPM